LETRRKLVNGKDEQLEHRESPLLGLRKEKASQNLAGKDPIQNGKSKTVRLHGEPKMKMPRTQGGEKNNSDKKKRNLLKKVARTAPLTYKEP